MEYVANPRSVKQRTTRAGGLLNRTRFRVRTVILIRIIGLGVMTTVNDAASSQAAAPVVAQKSAKSALLDPGIGIRQRRLVKIMNSTC
jgi:hypothetical protein